MTIFSKIVAGEIPAYKVAESNDFLAFLDINPLTEGHVLVIPKKEVDYLFDLDDETYTGLLVFAKIVAVGIKKAIPCERIGVVVMGLEVPHAHIHLIPMNQPNDINFANPKQQFTPEAFEATVLKIKEGLREEYQEDL
jgi:histidine triad (HIT) family protein